MLKMRLPAAEGDSNTAEGERRKNNGERGFNRLNPPFNGYNGCEEAAGARASRELDKESVFEWFGLRLSPARRVHFLTGLLHMCQPLELRFLGSCLEDLARKDFHVLRDVEARANSPADLRLLTNINDPVVLSHLLVCLPLLGSKNRECATILYGTLSRIDVLQASNCCGGTGNHQPEPVDPMEQLALLFAMASLHPAFTFHQREEIRAQLERVDALLEERNRNHCACAAPTLSLFSRPDELRTHDEGSRTLPSCPIQHRSSIPPSQVLQIEKIKLKEMLSIGERREYSFEVKWSDSSSTAVTKSHRELQNFLMKLCQEQSSGGFEQDVMVILSQADYELRDLERSLRTRFSSVPQEFLLKCQASGFFLPESSSLPCSHCKGSLWVHSTSSNVHGNSTPGARTRQPAHRFSEDCSETSSLEEDLDAYGVSCSRTQCAGNAGHGKQHSDGGQWDCSRRTVHGEVTARRRVTQSCETEQAQECEDPAVCVLSQGCSEERSALKTKGRPSTKRDRGRRVTGGKCFVANGIQRVPAVQMMNQAMCKATGRDTYGDTSSESSNSVPSSPIHHQRSLETQDTESQSDNSVPERADTPYLPSKKAVAKVNPLVTDPERVTPERPAPPSAVVELALTSCLPYALQYSTGHRDAGKPGESKLTITIPLGKQDPRSSVPAAGDSAQRTCPEPPQLQGLPTAATAGKPCAKAIAQPQTSLTPACLVQCPLANTLPTQMPTSGSVLPSALPQPDSSSYITNTACSGAAPQQQQTGCNTCGCRGTCATTHQSPTSFFLPAHPTRQLFGPPAPFFQLAPSLCSTTFPTQGHQGNGTPLPFYASPGAAFTTGALLHAHSDHLMTAQQPSYTLPQVTPFGRYFPPMFPSVGAVPGGAGMKKSGIVSCYNCGVSGHYAQECKQPSMEAGQPGGFRLKYISPYSAEALDKAD